MIKDIEKSGIIVSFFLLLFFSYGHFYQALNITSFSFAAGRISVEINKVLLPVWVIIFFLPAYFVVKTRKRLDNFTIFLNIIAGVLIVLSISSIGIHKLRTKSARETKKTGKDFSIEYKSLTQRHDTLPNIYFIIVDAYAGADILEEIYEYENIEFIDYLTQKGFYVANKANSNYCQTALTVASCLNLVYFDSFLDYVDIESYDFTPVKHVTKYNNVFRFLEQFGYKVVAFSSGRTETEIENADIYLTPGYVLDDFQNELINTTPIPAILEVAGMDTQFDLHRKRLSFILDHLSDTTKLQGPIFVFAHILAPHPPFVFGQDGEKLSPPGPFTDFDADWLIREGGLTRDEYIKGYRDQLIFINKKLESAIDDILTKSKEPPIIILQADHGPRSMMVWENPDKTYFKECFSILNAYYLPGNNYEQLYDEISPVNTFRIVFNSYFGTDFELLEDRVYFSTGKYPFKLMDVTDKVYPTYDFDRKKPASSEDLKEIQDRLKARVKVRSGVSKVFDDEVELANTLGRIKAKEGDIDGAISFFNRAIELDPNYAESYNNLGFIYHKKGDYERAKEYFEKTLEINPNHEKARMNLKNIDALMKIPKEERTRGEILTERDKSVSERVESLNNLGVEKGKSGDLEGAILLFNKAVELDPDHAESYNNLGYAYYKKGEYDRAEEYFKKTLEIDPDHEKARVNLDFIRSQGYTEK